MRRFAMIWMCLLLCGCQPPPAAPAAETVAEPAVVPTEAPAPLLPTAPADDAYRTYYELFVGSFCDSDGDGTGDLGGVLQKLDYINNGSDLPDSLHATGVWLMPVMTSPSYHKYDVSDYYSVDPAYGTTADFSALADACRSRGIRLILDLPVNHTSDEHPWFVSACESLAAGDCGGADACLWDAPCARHNPYCGYYCFTQELRGDVHPVPGVDGWYYFSAFTGDMPDLNLDNPAVRQEIRDVAAYWLDLGATGFRLDAVTSYYTGANAQNAAFLSDLYGRLKAIDPNVYLVAEAWTDTAVILDLAQSGVPSLFNFPFAKNDGAICKAINGGKGASLAARIAEWDALLHENNPSAIDAVFLSNHDMARSAGALRRDPVQMRQAAAVYLLMPGNAFIYYGEELGMTGGSKSDPDKRMPMIWSVTDTAGMTDPPPGAASTESLEAGTDGQLTDAASLLRFYIRAINIKQALPALARGRVTAVDTGADAVCAYRCVTEGETLLVLHNLSDTAVSLNGYAGFEPVAALDAGGEMPVFAEGTLLLPQHSTAVLRAP